MLDRLRNALTYYAAHTTASARRRALRDSLEPESVDWSLPAASTLRRLLPEGVGLVELLPHSESLISTIFSAKRIETVEGPLPRRDVMFLKVASALLEPLPPGLGAELRSGVFEALCERAYDLLLRPLEPVTTSMGLSSLAVVLRDPLARVPVHAALQQVGDSTSIRQLTYLPSLQTAKYLKPSAADLCVTLLVDPTNDLTIASAVASGIDGIEVTSGPDVTSRELLSQLKRPGHLIVCCHATERGLQLADGEFGARHLAKDFDCERSSVALLACRSALSASSRWSASGLVDSLLRAGAGVVLAAPWKVPEHSTIVFAEKWAQLLRSGLRPDDAYSRATAHVRALPLEAFRNWVITHLDRLGADGMSTESLLFRAALALQIQSTARNRKEVAIGRDLLSDAFPSLSLIREDETKWPLIELYESLLDLEERASRTSTNDVDAPSTPFAAPIHWAGFCLFGIGGPES
jgi:hypothetical protein